MSSNLDSSVKTLVDNSLTTLENLKEEIVDYEEILNNLIETGEKDRTIEDIEKDYPDKIEKLEEALNNYISENDLYILKTEFSNKKWK